MKRKPELYNLDIIEKKIKKMDINNNKRKNNHDIENLTSNINNLSVSINSNKKIKINYEIKSVDVSTQTDLDYNKYIENEIMNYKKTLDIKYEELLSNLYCNKENNPYYIK